MPETTLNIGTDHNVVIREAHQAWAAYDNLPVEVQRVLQDAPFDIDTVETADFIREGTARGWPSSKLVRAVSNSMAHAVKVCLDDWGPGYPAIPFTPLRPQSQTSRRFSPQRRRHSRKPDIFAIMSQTDSGVSPNMAGS